MIRAAGLGLLACMLGEAQADSINIELEDRRVRVRDVARSVGLDGLAASLVGAVVFHALPPGESSQDMTCTRISDLIRVRVPGLAGLVERDANCTFRLVAGATSSAGRHIRALLCARLSSPKEAGQIIQSTDTEPVVCPDSSEQGPVWFDTTDGVVRASRSLLAGSDLGRVLFGEPVLADRGETVQLSVSVGPVRVDRQVEAVRPVRPGQAGLVRDDQGVVSLLPELVFKGNEREDAS